MSPSPKPAPDVTALLIAWGQGDDQALNRLIPVVHGELRRIARRCLADERHGHTLQATALVNEAYLRLVETRRVSWHDRAHFLAMAARQMRRILIDAARARKYQKRGGDAVRVTFDEALPITIEPGRDLVALDEALTALARVHERKARGVELRFFGGLTADEIASVLQISSDTVLRDWMFSKAWLLRALRTGRVGV
jgi:RNA polymerase sigma-70 factor (ECF subfamily)